MHSNAYHLSDKEFSLFQKMIFSIAGISMSPAKKMLIAGRLGKRVKHHGFEGFHSYFQFISKEENRTELQMAVDLLTTNETYFFREIKHFDFLRAQLKGKARQGRPFRVWSAASSTGEEAFSIAMLLADILGDAPWEIIASDISSRVVEQARTGLYPILRSKDIPLEYLKRYCLKGVGENEGTFVVNDTLRSRVEFRQLNLNGNLPKLGHFDVIFLRNVMIYFNQDTKRQVVERLVPYLRPDGHFLIGHSESLHGVTNRFKSIKPSIYQHS